METFTVFDQREQILVDRERKLWKANLVEVGKVQANTSHEALDLATKHKLARFPVIGGRSLDALRNEHYRNARQRYE